MKIKEAKEEVKFWEHRAEQTKGEKQIESRESIKYFKGYIAGRSGFLSPSKITKTEDNIISLFHYCMTLRQKWIDQKKDCNTGIDYSLLQTRVKDLKELILAKE